MQGKKDTFVNTENAYFVGTNQMKHEQFTQREEHDFQIKLVEKEQELEGIKIGKLGKLFGNKENSSRNICALICIVLLFGVFVVIMIVYFTTRDVDFIEKILGLTLPIVTLSIGYLFGQGK